MPSVEEVEYSDFRSPQEESDLVIEVGGTELYANSGLLAVHSPVFRVMLFGAQWKEAQDRRTNMEGYQVEEVVELLRCITPQPYYKPVDGGNVAYLSKLAEEYQMAQVRRSCEHFLIADWSKNPANCMKALILSWRYQYQKAARSAILTVLKSGEDACMSSITPVPAYVGEQTSWRFIELLQRLSNLKDVALDRVCDCGLVADEFAAACAECERNFESEDIVPKCTQCGLLAPKYRTSCRRRAYCTECATESFPDWRRGARHCFFGSKCIIPLNLEYDTLNELLALFQW